MLFGEVHENTVNTLNVVVTGIYKPYIDKLTSDDWGSCEPEAKKEFMTTFVKSLLPKSTTKDSSAIHLNTNQAHSLLMLPVIEAEVSNKRASS